MQRIFLLFALAGLLPSGASALCSLETDDCRFATARPFHHSLQFAPEQVEQFPGQHMAGEKEADTLQLPEALTALGQLFGLGDERDGCGVQLSTGGSAFNCRESW